MKKVAIGLAVIVILVAGGFFYIWTNLGSIIKDVVERAGTHATGVTVSLDTVDVEKLTKGSAGLRGLTVGNPKGFTSDYAFKLGEISVALDATTVTSDVIVIKDVVIAGPQVIYELGSGGSNIATIQKNVDRIVGGGTPASGQSTKSEPSKKKIVIENLRIRDGTIEVNTGTLGGQKMRQTLPAIHLRNIGKSGGANKGATPAEVAAKIIDAITEHAMRAVGKLNIGAIKDAVSGATGKLKESVPGIAKDAEKGLKNLFGK